MERLTQKGRMVEQCAVLPGKQNKFIADTMVNWEPLG